MTKGIDVSKHNGAVDFQSVKAAGYNFVMIRAGYGRLIGQKDPNFEENYRNAKAAGLGVGAYWYSYAKTEAEARMEANVCLEAIKGKTFEYPIAFDIEDRSQTGLPNETIGAMINTFCTTLEIAGYYVSLYSYASFLKSKVPEYHRKRFDVWVAHFDVEKPNYDGAYGMWQYTSKAKVDGIGGNCDCDQAYKDYPATIKSAGLNGFKKMPATEPVQPAVAAETYQAGKNITLREDPVYASATAAKATTRMTGTYYLYDGKLVNGRFRITTSKAYCGKEPIGKYVTGWVNKSDI